MSEREQGKALFPLPFSSGHDPLPNGERQQKDPVDREAMSASPANSVKRAALPPQNGAKGAIRRNPDGLPGAFCRLNRRAAPDGNLDAESGWQKLAKGVTQHDAA